MSASAEVYISVDNSDRGKRDDIQSAIESALREVGFDITDKTKFSVGYFHSGIVVECKGFSIGWEVFEQQWSDSIVRAVAGIDAAADAEVYVYNLDREADVVSTTHMMRRNDDV